jgi:hypothetical protein
MEVGEEDLRLAARHSTAKVGLWLLRGPEGGSNSRFAARHDVRWWVAGLQESAGTGKVVWGRACGLAELPLPAAKPSSQPTPLILVSLPQRGIDDSGLGE